jgi:hypothetical protein
MAENAANNVALNGTIHRTHAWPNPASECQVTAFQTMNAYLYEDVS